MPNELLGAAVALWLAGALVAIALSGADRIARVLLALGCLAGLVGAAASLPAGATTVRLPLGIAGHGTLFRLDPAAAWLMLFGLVAAALACALGTPAAGGRRSWAFGAAVSLIGAVGTFGTQDAIAFLVSWELMSLGGAIMILGERMAPDTGRPVLFMLAALEAGAVALLTAFLVLGNAAGAPDFAGFAAAGASLGMAGQVTVGLLLLVGFGAKLGLLPFYEWFPGAYGAGSGATGAMMSGVVLNAAYFGLARGLATWLPAPTSGSFPLLGVIVVAIAVVSAVLAALYAFQQENWRELLSFSSAENASVAVAVLGASLIFAADPLPDLAALAWIVALLHLAGHALAKGGMFLSADAVLRATGRYAIRQFGLLRRAAWPLGLGALFAAMSLAAMPPQAGFVSEWYVFQTVFQGFHLHALGSRLVLALAGAGFAVTAAVALATFVKVMGIGLLGRAETPSAVKFPSGNGGAVCILGLCVLALAVGMPWWLSALTAAVPGGMAADAAARMRDGWILVPLTAKFAFISPTKLVIAMPCLALLPVGLLLVARRRAVRRVAVWYGGREQDPRLVSTTALAFSNALRTFYSFVYRPTATATRELAAGANGHPYFIRRLVFDHRVAPIFGPYLFAPLIATVNGAARRLRALQSGHLNFYLALVGGMLFAILVVTLM